MKKIALASMIAVCGSVFAGPKTPTTIACAVMPSNKVNVASATAKHMYSDYKGHRYFFCCGGCPDAFKKDPAKYAKSASIPTPKK
jgi:YHS domain-containing protein